MFTFKEVTDSSPERIAPWSRYLLKVGGVSVAITVLSVFVEPFRAIGYLLLHPAYWGAHCIAWQIKQTLPATTSAWRFTESVEAGIFGVLCLPYLAVCLLPSRFRRNVLGLRWPVQQAIVFLPGLAWGILVVADFIIGIGAMRQN